MLGNVDGSLHFTVPSMNRLNQTEPATFSIMLCCPVLFLFGVRLGSLPWFLLLGRVGVAFIGRRLSLLILFIIFFGLSLGILIFSIFFRDSALLYFLRDSYFLYFKSCIYQKNKILICCLALRLQFPSQET
jgi:phosphotransferase system  glucose/maltose/N-acetylglucosamine-specific IIC component